MAERQLKVTLLQDARYNSIDYLKGAQIEIAESIASIWLAKGICEMPGIVAQQATPPQEQATPPQEETDLEAKLLATSVDDLVKIAEGLELVEIPEDKLDLVLAIIAAGYTG